MLVEDLLTLPEGTPVVGQIETVTNVQGTVETFRDGSHFIRRADGYATISLGKVRDYDEYIAAHTHLAPGRCRQVPCDPGVAGAMHDDELVARLSGFSEQYLNSLEDLNKQTVGVRNV